MYIALKFLITAAIIVGASELAKRFSTWSYILLALPFTSLLTLVWIYFDTHDEQKLAATSWGVFWLVPPSLVFFPVFAWIIERKWPFYAAMGLGALAALTAYFIYAKVLDYFGIRI